MPALQHPPADRFRASRQHEVDSVLTHLAVAAASG